LRQGQGRRFQDCSLQYYSGIMKWLFIIYLWKTILQLFCCRIG